MRTLDLVSLKSFKRGGSMAQVIEHLPGKSKALGSDPRTEGRKEGRTGWREGRRGEGEGRKGGGIRKRGGGRGRIKKERQENEGREGNEWGEGKREGGRKRKKKEIKERSTKGISHCSLWSPPVMT
jgi:hypothetical protein